MEIAVHAVDEDQQAVIPAGVSGAPARGGGQKPVQRPPAARQGDMHQRAGQRRICRRRAPLFFSCCHCLSGS
jgi:hypothetical protein